ncbi:MauE/DoxX family redox-associated membrane protein [Alteromonas sp. 14N.309.X.WAT.G.H12]|uniref:MauE/DoxX family redox-associated membrane protein n=1 Tax=Alteromonas sp. 14N.309.X.WAT.G.H12 TaxID=3120824 RepID=UPI002FD14061
MLTVFLQVLQIGLFGFFLSLILASSVHKLKNPGRFRQALVAYELLPAPLALTFAKFVPFIELGIVIAALITFAIATPVITTALLVMLFATYGVFLGYAALTQKSLNDCGCSLNNTEAGVAPAKLFVRNTILIALVALFYASSASYGDTLAVWITGIVFSLILFITYSSIDSLLENQALLKNLRFRHD